MAYSIIADHRHLSIFNRVKTASEARRLAALRRQQGAGAVAVYGEGWSPVSTSELETVGNTEPERISGAAAAAPSTLLSAPGVTIKLGGKTERQPADVNQGREARSRVRVFKAAGPKSDL